MNLTKAEVLELQAQIENHMSEDVDEENHKRLFGGLCKDFLAMHEALAFYGDKENWVCDPNCHAECTADGCSNEGGAKARECVKAL